MRSALFYVGLAFALVIPFGLVIQKEHVLATGQSVLLELAPRDPRSLMQGDYMVLDYAITRGLNGDGPGTPNSGLLVLNLDEHGVGHYVRHDSPGTPLAPGELKLRYRRRDGRTRLGAESFFFQEGHADRYAQARYAELRMASNGSSVLVGLRDAQRAPLGAEPADSETVRVRDIGPTPIDAAPIDAEPIDAEVQAAPAPPVDANTP